MTGGESGIVADRVARPFLPLWAAVLLALASGPVTDAAFPDRGWWPLAFLGVGLLLISLWGRRPLAGFFLGVLFGASFYLLHIHWATVFLGPVPWLALSLLMALWSGFGAMLIAWAIRVIPQAVRGKTWRMFFLPVIISGLWTLREALQSVWPYGGFAWGRIALSQSVSPVATLFAWVGISGVSALMVFGVALVITAIREHTISGSARLTILTGVSVLLLAFPAFPVPTMGEIRVAAVQGNGKTGYFDPPEYRGENLADQLSASEAVYPQNVDLVVWPEGGSDLDPQHFPQAASAFDLVSEQAGAPLVSGVITERGAEFFNTAVLWRAGEGVNDFYDKKHPVPFGEYVPDRPFWRQFAPELIDLIGREYTPGSTDTVLDVGSFGREILAGVAICFDIVDDAILRQSVREGAQLLLAPTNNADFGRSDESVQQLAIARIRAIEMGRAVINISTVGTSAIILPNGSLAAELPWYIPGAMVEDVPLAQVVTPAVRLGLLIEWGVSLLAVGALIGTALGAGSRRCYTR